jgi:N-acetylglucosaminyl-diphospho-decaprenol L-rhamnosyltransferase
VTQGVETPTDLAPVVRSRAGSMIDAVVVAYQSASIISQCITQLSRIPGLGQIVVIDHGNDGAGAIAGALGATVAYDPGNPGFGAGQNRGLTLTTAPYVLMCNPDAMVVPEAIADGVAVMKAESDLAALQGTVRERDRDLAQRSSWQSVGPAHLWARIFRFGPLLRVTVLRDRAVRHRLLPAAPPASHDVEALAAIALLVRHDALKQVGGFDPGYFLYWEDIDLCKRLRRSGWRLRVTPDVWAVHAGGASSSEATEREHQWWKGCMRYAALWYTGGQWVAALSAASLQWLACTLARPSMASTLWQDLITAPRRVRRHRTA